MTLPWSGVRETAFLYSTPQVTLPDMTRVARRWTRSASAVVC